MVIIQYLKCLLYIATYTIIYLKHYIQKSITLFEWNWEYNDCKLCNCDVMTKMLDCSYEVREFKPQLHYYNYILNWYTWERYKLFYPSQAMS